MRNREWTPMDANQHKHNQAKDRRPISIETLVRPSADPSRILFVFICADSWFLHPLGKGYGRRDGFDNSKPLV
jgi:hypothetical protein